MSSEKTKNAVGCIGSQTKTTWPKHREIADILGTS